MRGTSIKQSLALPRSVRGAGRSLRGSWGAGGAGELGDWELGVRGWGSGWQGSKKFGAAELGWAE